MNLGELARSMGQEDSEDEPLFLKLLSQLTMSEIL